METGRASSVTKNYEVYEESSYYQRSTSLPRAMRGIERHVEVASSGDLLRRRQEGLFHVVVIIFLLTQVLIESLKECECLLSLSVFCCRLLEETPLQFVFAKSHMQIS